jgi:hypothetical protein
MPRLGRQMLARRACRPVTCDNVLRAEANTWIGWAAPGAWVAGHANLYSPYPDIQCSLKKYTVLAKKEGQLFESQQWEYISRHGFWSNENRVRGRG